jgi:hypothetical protein
MVAVGGLMPVLYNSGSASAALCFHLGAATPLLLAKLIASIPAIAQEQGMVDRSSATFRGFIDW